LSLLVKILAPLVPLVHVLVRHDEEMAAVGREGLADELHVGFFGRPARFTPVAFHARADDVFPRMLTAAEARYDVVER